MFHLPLTSATIDFQWSPAMGMGVDSVQTPGEVSFRSTRLVPPPCHDATPKKMAPSAAEFGVTCTLTVPVLPSADGVSLMLVRTLPTSRGSGMKSAASSTAPASARAPTGMERLPLWNALPNPAPRTAAPMAAGSARATVGRISLAELGPAGNHPETLYQMDSPASPRVPTRAPATSPNLSRSSVPTHQAAASTARADGRDSGNTADAWCRLATRPLTTVRMIRKARAALTAPHLPMAMRANTRAKPAAAIVRMGR